MLVEWTKSFFLYIYISVHIYYNYNYTGTTLMMDLIQHQDVVILTI